MPMARLETYARDLATPSRLLAAGYAFVAPTYRSRDVDLQTTDSLDDALAVVEYLHELRATRRQFDVKSSRQLTKRASRFRSTTKNHGTYLTRL